MSAEVKSMKEWALYYAELGLAVFPLAYRNKVPAIEGGCKAATTEKSKIERWWNQNPRYNIGIATGNKSNGLVVIDLDVDKNKGIDGYEVLRDWQNKHGELPETWQSITGRGGYHYFYKDTITHSNKVGLYEGVDIRGEGGYIVAPPSVHPNGNTYEWEQEPKEYEIAQVDDIVNDFFKGEKQRIDSEHKTNFKVPELIPEGKRVDTIVRLIASLRTKAIASSTVSSAIDNVLKRLRQQDIEIERFTHHAFRDTFATRYIEEGGNMQTLQKILGHSSLAMTADLYAHVLPNTKQQEMQQIENGFIGVAVL